MSDPIEKSGTFLTTQVHNDTYGNLSDLIDREDVLALAKDIVVPIPTGEYRHRCIDPQEVRELPPAQPQRMHGKWIKGIGENGVTTSLFCDQCRYENRHWYEWNFCPNCGADMREEQSDGEPVPKIEEVK